jgi:hypothetical protein
MPDTFIKGLGVLTVTKIPLKTLSIVSFKLFMVISLNVADAFVVAGFLTAELTFTLKEAELGICVVICISIFDGAV